MRISGQELISRNTAAAHFRLMAFAATMFAVGCFDLNDESWSLGLRDLTPDQVWWVAVGLLIYAFASYALHLFGDLIFFFNWVSEGKIVDSGWDTVGDRISVFDVWKRSAEQAAHAEQKLVGNLSGTCDAPADVKALEEAAQQFLSATQSLKRAFSDVHKGYRRISRAGYAIVGFWYVLTPIVAIGLATRYFILLP
ncbi:hypothetical protein MACH21_24240 [Roseicyclus marinus]|uniref:Uncharacterized protein n=2 Tax=Roseicyclus marinus TaxID=2161673 RepID=A0AA48KIW2_9RHOB|nr:hypothetical protein MACH21_24240 [Roseicyclus marinus]